MRALVTGAAGFVGASVARALLKEGFEVRALVRSNSSTENLKGLDVEIALGDIRDFDAVASAMPGCQHVFHLAALYSQSESDIDRMYEVNVEGTKNLLKAAFATPCRGGFQGKGSPPSIERFVHTSTIGTIGRTTTGGLPNENTAFNYCESSSHYVRSKYMGEQVALCASHRGLPVIVVHPCAPVGPGDLKPTVTGQRVVDFLTGKMPSYVSGGINFVDVEDVAKGHILAAKRGRPGERYILGNRNLSRHDFLSLVEVVSGQKAPDVSSFSPLARIRNYLRPASSPPTGFGGPQSLTCDCSWSIKELGLPQTPLELSMEKAVNWFRDHGYAKAPHDEAWENARL